MPNVPERVIKAIKEAAPANAHRQIIAPNPPPPMPSEKRKSRKQRKGKRKQRKTRNV